MYELVLWLVFGVFVIATLALALYGLHLYALLLLFRRRVTRKSHAQRAVIDAAHRDRPPNAWPAVTTQIPLYNESGVAERVIEAAAAMDYPPGKHEIQVLDDSSDETREIVDRCASRLGAKGVTIRVVRRPDRHGYKAGALAYGLERAAGEYVAIFDSDFVPPRDFLRRAVPLLDADPKLACLQGRWAHLNREESWLTEAQALGIDGHFAIEQGARAWNGLMMNFNGTGGIWRRVAIEDPAVGGWSGDTLTEDLDLSYRAQLAGWKLDYCLDLACPAELPGTVEALKSQQRRWATGSIQVARKLLPRIWRARLSLGEKVEATLHLTHYSVAIWMLLVALVARPIVVVVLDPRWSDHWFWGLWFVILVSGLAPSFVYAYARYRLEGRWTGFRTIPSMMILGCGMCLNNSLAVVRGWTLRGGEFIRTPKSGSTGRQARSSTYQVAQDHLWLAELGLGFYSLFSFVVYLREFHSPFSIFLFLYALGFLLVGWLSRPKGRPRPAGSAARVDAPFSVGGHQARPAGASHPATP